MVLTVKFQSKVFLQLVAHLQLLVITAMDTMLNLKRSINITINTTTPRRILVTKESMRKSMDLLPTTDLFSHNHGEESRKLIHKMDSRTQLSNGSINQQLLHKVNNNHAMDSMDSVVKYQQKEYHQLEDHLQLLVITAMVIMPKKKRETLEIKESMRKYMVLLRMINQFFQSHGEELKNHIQSMVVSIQNGNGLTNQL
jgi:hypothetical protein